METLHPVGREEASVPDSPRRPALAVWHRTSIGGIIVYDDYGFQQCSGITKHVEEQIHDPDRVVLHNLNGHAVIIKIR